VNDLASIDRAVAEAMAETDRPTLVLVHSHIGIGSPLQDTSKAHGAPLGAANAEMARHHLAWQHPPFEIPPAVYDHWRPTRGGLPRSLGECQCRPLVHEPAIPLDGAPGELLMAGEPSSATRLSPHPSKVSLRWRAHYDDGSKISSDLASKPTSFSSFPGS
jgi:Transketolase